jgi:PAS domain S-box-containing protein
LDKFYKPKPQMKNLLLGITQANHYLLKEKHFEQSLQGVVKSLGENSGVDRCYVFQNETENNIIKLYYRYEWCADGISEEIDNPDLNGLTYDEFPGLYELLKNDQAFNTIVSQMPEDNPLKELLTYQNIKTILILPILVESTLWGWIGFDDCHIEKEWIMEEIYTLHSVAKNIGLRISQEKANKHLEDTLEMFDFYMKGSNQAMWELNLENQEVYFSYNWMGMLGYKPFEFKYTFENWRKRVHPNEIERILNELNNYISGNAVSYEGIARLRHKKGHYVWVKYSGLLKRDKNDKPLKIIGTHIDVSELKEKEITIKEKSQELNQILENINEAVFRLDKNHQITFFSPFWKKISGYSVEESIGKSIYHFINPENLDEFKKHMTQISSSENQSFELEVYLQTKKESKWVSVRIKSYQIENSILFAGRFLDIHDKKIAQDNLKISERKYRFIAENTTDLISIINLDGTIDYVSNSVKQITGYSPYELLLKPWKKFLHKDDIPAIVETYRINYKSLKNQSNNILTFRIKSKKGKYIWLETSFNFLRNTNNRLVGIQCSSRDVSERIRINEELKESLDKEKRLNLLKSSFVSTVSHQFRTPLTVIYSNMELLELTIKNIADEKLINRVNIISERIKSEVGRMTDMMDNILLFGKFEAGKISLKPMATHPVEFLEKTIATYFSNLPDGRKVEVEYGHTHSLILLDEQLTTHVINNLMSNAIKYSMGSKNPVIKIENDNSNTTIKIIDYGIGIPKEDMDKLYNSFFRASNTDTFQGYGLGLVIAKEFTEIQNGTIAIESEINKGTTVILKFPNL